MKDVSLSLTGDAPALASVLEEYAAHAVQPFHFVESGGDLQVVFVRDAKTLDAQLKIFRAQKPAAATLLVLDQKLDEPDDEPAELGLAGIFRLPVRLPALLDAGFFHLRMAALKAPRKLSDSVVFNPFTRMLEDQSKGVSEMLTPKEADLLLALMEAGKDGLTREAALTRIWGYHREADSHAVETATWRLRRKLEALFGGAGVLESRGSAYFLTI
jgi:DNA-binding response OmpR family regulator